MILNKNLATVKPAMSKEIRHKLIRSLLTLLIASAALLSFAGSSSVREEEIMTCQAGEIETWPDGNDHPITESSLKFFYSAEHAPTWLDEKTVRSALEDAATSWSACGIQMSILRASLITPKKVIRVQWNERESRGNVGVSDLTNRVISLAPSTFELIHSKNPSYDARITLQMTLSHEMGHFLGLEAHSKRCVDVLSYYTYGADGVCFSRDKSQFHSVIEYRSSLPTECDIERCKRLNQPR
jgi:hypothetical protein